jgi:tRNA-modifying protein YgfZ
MIDCLRGDHAQVGATLKGAGAVDCSHAAYDALRIEAGFPLFGHDITAQNLPQEVSRDSRTISYTKGCYLGQETVARIDALGHVNRNLVRLRFLGSQIPPIGASLLAGEDSVGTVTSAAWSPHFQSPLALGYVRRGFNTPGTRLTFAADVSEVEVMPLVSA